jgi:molybdopterin converting factor small subunit
MKVRVPTPLYSYTGQRAEVDASGTSLADVVADLDRQFPGLRFRIVDEQDRIRPHIKVFVGDRLAPSLGQKLAATDAIMIVAALSGG